MVAPVVVAVGEAPKPLADLAVVGGERKRNPKDGVAEAFGVEGDGAAGEAFGRARLWVRMRCSGERRGERNK